MYKEYRCLSLAQREKIYINRYWTSHYLWELLCSHKITTKTAALTRSILGNFETSDPTSESFNTVS